MAKLIITREGILVKEYDLLQEKIKVGRKPSNDIILDDPTVSGEHAVFLNMQNVYVEDSNSMNGLTLNGQAVKKRQLKHGDRVQIGHHEFKFIDDIATDFESTVVIPTTNVASEKSAVIKKASMTYLQGDKKGESIVLNKPFTKFGAADQVAIIARRGGSYYLMPMSSGDVGCSPSLNGKQIGAESMLLTHSDVIDIAELQLQFSMI